MGKKIKVVDIVNEEPINEVMPDVEQVTVETNEPDVVEQVTVEPVVEQVEQIPKPKAKTRSKKKQSVETHEVPTLEVEPAQEVEATPERLTTAAVEVNKDKVKKVIEQVKCQKCDKMMSQKSLRYTHEENCKGKVVKTEDLPVKRRNVKPTKEPTKQEVEVKPTTNKKEIYKQIVGKNVNLHSSEVEIPEELKLEVLESIQRQQARIKMKEDNLSKLEMQFF